VKLLQEVFSPRVDKAVRTFLSDEDDVEEATQMVWISVWKNYEAFHASPQSALPTAFGKWLDRLARNYSLSIRRETRQDADVFDLADELPSTDLGPAELFEEAEERNIIFEKMYSVLTPRQYDALYLSLFWNKTTKEVADTMGVSRNTAYQHIHRAREILKEVYGNDFLAGLV
jgi:RNA polymerase sigma factor (sigma-70 family)